MNYSEKTGIPFGIMQGNNAPELLDEIMMNGKNLTFEYCLENLKSQNSDAPVEYQANAIHVFCEDYESDEDEYEHEVDGMKLGASCLGGAYLIWVYESPHTARVRECSPCIPGAGDLDSPDIDHGMECYSVSQDWLEDNS
mgnify:CR=1 FL=1